MDEEDTAVIADWGNDRIVEWKLGATNGRVLAGGNGQGNGTDQLNRPTDVIFDKEADNVIICDRWNRRVTRWPRRSGIRGGETIIDNIACWGLAIDDDGSLYITDVEKHDVRRYRRSETSGIVMAGGNGKGAGLHQLNFPMYVCVDEEHAVYISDYENHRVMKWVKGAKEGIVVAGGQGEGKGLTQLYFPNGVLVDAAGTVYVADWGNARVIRWYRGATQGRAVVDGNEERKAANQDNPVGMSLDHRGHLYVADLFNHRVQRFSIEY